MSGTDSAAPSSALLATLAGERRERPPIWLMRQAGRYLPEYRALRAEAPDFLRFCYDPALAAEATLQPIRRFGFDAAIIFSDILVIPDALGLPVAFLEGEGPRIEPLDLARLGEIEGRDTAVTLEPVYEALRLVRAALDPSVALLGFAGAPWTLATYMVGGRDGADKAAARRVAYADPERFDRLCAILAEAVADHLARQVAAGADAVQIFDSWAGSLDPEGFERWVERPTAAIVASLRGRGVTAPIIGFPRGAGARLAGYAAATGVDAVSIDSSVPLVPAALPPASMPVQGALDPMRLVAGGAGLDAAIDAVIAGLADRPHVFNLGHGITPDCPIAHVEHLVRRVRAG